MLADLIFKIESGFTLRIVITGRIFSYIHSTFSTKRIISWELYVFRAKKILLLMKKGKERD